MTLVEVQIAAAEAVTGKSLDISDLLDEVARVYRRFICMSPEQADTLALHCAHTHAFEASRRTPYIYLTSAEKRSGKSRTLEIARHLVRGPLPTANISPAALYRIIERKKPTLLFDEVDGIFAGHKSERNEDLRVLLNSGFEYGTPAYRCVGANREEVAAFNVYCPKVLAGLRNVLPDTVRDRSIVIELWRKAPNEAVEEFGDDNETELINLRDRLAAWGAGQIETLRLATPDRPKELHDRARDVWKPLLAIADLAGGDWPTRARAAAIALSGNADNDESLGIRLLSDIRAIYLEHHQEHEHVFSKFLAEQLAAMEDAPWGPRRGRDFDARDLATLLKRFKVHPEPKTVRIGDKVGRAYRWASFFDGWNRFLTTLETNVTTVTTVTTTAEPVTQLTMPPLRSNPALHDNGHDVTNVTVVTRNPGIEGDGHSFTIEDGDLGTHCVICKLPWAEHHKPARSAWTVLPRADDLFYYLDERIPPLVQT